MSSKKLIAQIVIVLLFVGSLAACDKKEQPEAIPPASTAMGAGEPQPAAEPQPVVVAQPEGDNAEHMPAEQEADAQPEIPAAEDAAPADSDAAAQH